ncbi:THUMP domain-containing protein 1 isoform X2 [Nilaparvata lugens]|uniref:THUMP domain-containing protein 1 isoform X2 n=1 Tax=Nilaparvata lugens TaxID=108931 RepID=UPI00193DC02C|nr:THUMP domain-containing protein 1 isoform X2 [Nilaparvata lugens]
MALSVDINGALYILHKIFQKWILKKVDDEYVIENDAEIEDELEREVKSLKKSTKSGERRFQVVESGANCCVFIKAKIPDPVKLAATIMEDVASTKTQKTRYLIRLLPVEVTCKAYMDSIKKAADSLFDKYFKCEPTTFAIVYKIHRGAYIHPPQIVASAMENPIQGTMTIPRLADCDKDKRSKKSNKRNNDNLLRDEVIQSLAVLVEDKNILHKVDLRQARLTVVVEVIKSICCLSVVPDFFKYCKYNLMQLSKDDDSANGNADKTPASGATEKENEEKLCKSTEESRSAELSDKNCETVTDISKAGDNVAPDDSVPVIQKT